MTPEESKTFIATTICLRLVNLHESTGRRELVIKLKKPELLDEMEQHGLCRSINDRKAYLPTVSSFGLSSDTQLAENARLGTTRVIHTLRNLFEVYDRVEPYTFSDLAAQASKLYDVPLQAADLRLGLYLSADLGALQSIGREPDGIDINSFTIPESIVSYEDPELIWDARVEIARNNLKGRLTFFPATEAQGPANEQIVDGTRAWYFAESRKLEQKTLRCPFASVDLCPRYFQSLHLSDELGATGMTQEDVVRAQAKWDSEPSFASLKEQLPSVQRGDARFSSLVNFCPEVVYDIFSIFAAMLGRYVDEIDHDAAMRVLRRRDAPLEDPAWSWGFVVPLHYTACPTFSLLAGRRNDSGTTRRALLDALLTLPGVDSDYVSQQIARLKENDPELAIGTAKEILETCCKTILKSTKAIESVSMSLPALLKETVQAIQDLNELAGVTSEVQTIVRPLSSLVQSIAEMRNTHGTGHGKSSGSSVGAVEARLAVDAVTALCIYLATSLPKQKN